MKKRESLLLYVLMFFFFSWIFNIGPSTGTKSPMTTKNFTLPTITGESLAREVELKSQQIAEFRKLAQDTLKSLPTVEDVRSTLASRGAHQTPPIVMAAALKMKKVGDVLEKNHQLLKAEAKSFYEACAAQGSVWPAITQFCAEKQREI